MPDQADVQRSLGRLEGVSDQILAELRSLRVEFGDHKNEDQKNFSAVRALVYDQRRDISGKLEAQDATRERHLSEQDLKLDKLKQDSDRAKGAGWAILGLLGSLATFVGGAVLAVVEGWIKVHS